MKKKLLFIVPIFPKNKNEDTIVPFIYQFTLFLTNHYQIDIDVLSIRYPKGKPYKIDKIKIYPLGNGFKRKWFTIWTIIKSVYYGLILFKKNKYHGILTFWYSENAVIGNFLSTIFRKKHFIWMQGQDVKPDNKYLKIRFSKSKNLITVGKNHQQLLKKYWNLNSIVANVAIEPNSFPNLNTSKRPIDIIGVGNLSALKNFSLFVEIIFELKKIFNDIKAIICGNGEEMDMLYEKISKLNLSENIKLYGYVSNKEVKSLLNQSNILLHTSKFEGNSVAVQEALFCGCQVVSTIPLLESVEHFFTCNDKEEIIEQLKFLLSKKSLSLKRVQPFKMEDTAKRILSLFFD